MWKQLYEPAQFEMWPTVKWPIDGLVQEEGQEGQEDGEAKAAAGIEEAAQGQEAATAFDQPAQENAQKDAAAHQKGKGPQDDAEENQEKAVKRRVKIVQKVIWGQTWTKMRLNPTWVYLESKGIIENALRQAYFFNTLYRHFEHMDMPEPWVILVFVELFW